MLKSTVNRSIRTFVVDEDARPRAGVAIALAKGDQVLSILQSDHAGYAAFARPIPREEKTPTGYQSSSISKLSYYQPPATALPSGGTEDGFEVYALAVPSKRVKVNDDGLVLLTVPKALSVPQVPTWLPSVADATLDDWRISPTSFGTTVSAAVGSGACETIFPNGYPEHLFHFHQLVPDLQSVQVDGKLRTLTGTAHTYRVSWTPAGHALGELLYSLPLAPGERTNVALIDWSRQDAATRQDPADFNAAIEGSRDR